MSSTSTLVNVAEDAELRLVRLLAETAPPNLLGSSFVQDCETCIIGGDAFGLVNTITADRGAIAALFVLEEDAVSAFSLLAALLDRVDLPEQQRDIAASLADAVVDSVLEEETEEMATRRITLLSTLYNLRSDGGEKCTLLARMVRLAAATCPVLLEENQPLGNLLLTHRLVAMLDAWNVPMADRRDLYKVITDAIRDSPRKQRFTLLLVDSYKNEAQVDEQGLAAAKDAAIGAIRDPVTLFTEQRGMLTMPPVQALEKKEETKILYGLLTIFAEKKLQDYEAFCAKYSGVLDSYGLDSKTCIRYMRILSLCSLAAEHEEIPYSTVAQTLQLSSEEKVESWVIAAVSSGLLAAKMDQLEQKVMVERAVVRRFDMEQWKALQSRLNVWKHNVRGILEAFKQQQTQASMSAANP